MPTNSVISIIYLLCKYCFFSRFVIYFFRLHVFLVFTHAVADFSDNLTFFPLFIIYLVHSLSLVTQPLDLVIVASKFKTKMRTLYHPRAATFLLEFDFWDWVVNLYTALLQNPCTI